MGAGPAWADGPMTIGSTNLSTGSLHEAQSAVAGSGLLVMSRAGNVYEIGVSGGSAAGFLLGYDLTAKPSDGTVTPTVCIAVASGATAKLSWSPGPALRVDNGMYVVFSTGATCFTQTTSSGTAFLWGAAQ